MPSKNCIAWVIAGMAMSAAAVAFAAGDDLWLEQTVGVKKNPADKNWVPMQTFTLNQTAAARKMNPAKLDKYGGRMDRQDKATGFFRVEKRGDGWQMVDPEGYEFISVGLNDVAMSATQNGKKALEQLFGTPENWTKRTAELLKSNGFNTLACESEFSIFRKAGCPLAYTPNLYWMSGYGKKRGGTYQQPGHTGYPKDCIFVFDPGFEEYCNEEAKKLVESKDDPWLLGYFSDNELPLSGKILSAYLSLPESDPGYQAAQKWFAERVGGIDRKPTQEDEEAFLEVVTDRYHRIVITAMKKYDPNHLYLGSRTHGDCYKSPAVMRAYGRNVDIMSINYYRAWYPDKELLSMWKREGKKPFMITEWYAKGEDSRLANTTGWGWLVKTQPERGYFYQTFTRGLLADPNCVGWHWFKYMDNDPTDTTMDPSNLDSNKGIVSMLYEPYKDLLDAMKVMNFHIYPLADSMRK
jgi:hypothetical protein